MCKYTFASFAMKICKIPQITPILCHCQARDKAGGRIQSLEVAKNS